MTVFEVTMRQRALVGGIALIGALLVLVAPALAQDTGTSVAYGGVAFSLDPSLGPSVNVTDVPGTPDSEFPPPEPPHLAFALYPSAAEGDRVDRVGWGSFVLRFYPVAGIAGYTDSSDNLAQLQHILAERPDLSPYMEASHTGYLPYAPVPQAAQVLRARVHYVNAAQLSGVAYVTAWSQEQTAFAAGDFWYTFQGLSSDGTWYVSVDVVLDASMFPKTVPPSAGIFANNRAYEAYIDQSIAKLNNNGPRKFSPSLTAVNDLVNSITFDSVTAAASPSESAFPLASESPFAVPSEAPAASATESTSPSSSPNP
jgi:hypothetical protein